MIHVINRSSLPHTTLVKSSNLLGSFHVTLYRIIHYLLAHICKLVHDVLYLKNKLLALSLLIYINMGGQEILLSQPGQMATIMAITCTLAENYSTSLKHSEYLSFSNTFKNSCTHRIYLDLFN